jgi:hypothetical protein
MGQVHATEIAMLRLILIANSHVTILPSLCINPPILNPTTGTQLADEDGKDAACVIGEQFSVFHPRMASCLMFFLLLSPLTGLGPIQLSLSRRSSSHSTACG